jgi:hypothetical protein
MRLDNKPDDVRPRKVPANPGIRTLEHSSEYTEGSTSETMEN